MFTLHRTHTLFRTLTVLGLALAAPGFAAEVVLPHAFSPGTPARANEVNANFAAVRNGVNANDAAITNLNTQVQDLGTQVQDLDAQVQNLDSQVQSLPAWGPLAVEVGGFIVGTLFNHSEFDGSLLTLSDTGYFFAVDGGTVGFGYPEGALTRTPIYFDNNTCDGNAYYVNSGDYANPEYFYFRQGYVIASHLPGQAFLIQGTPSNQIMRSMLWSGYDIEVAGAPAGCVDLGAGISRPAIPLAPNNPTVTGVPNNLAGPVRISPRGRPAP